MIRRTLCASLVVGRSKVVGCNEQRMGIGMDNSIRRMAQFLFDVVVRVP